MMSTDPAGDETCPERGRAEMPITFTNLPLRPRDDLPAPPSHTMGRNAIWISSSFDPEHDSLAMR
jgi:hypothetical protein